MAISTGLVLALAVGAGAADGGSAAAKAPLQFGIGAPNGEEQAKRAQSLIEPYLSKALGQAVRVNILPDYEALSPALLSRQVDAAWLTPIMFVLAHAANPDVKALMKARRNGASFYRTAFIVKKDSPIKSLPELRGKRVAWVARTSASGYLFPRALLARVGQDPNTFFASELIAGTHPAVCKAVRDGTADVGATLADQPVPGKEFQADGCFDSPPISDFRVVAATEPIPNDVIAVRPGLDAKVIAAVSNALSHMGDTPEGKKVLTDAFRVEAWAPVADQDFAPVEQVLNAVPAGSSPPASAKAPDAAQPPPASIASDGGH